MREYVDDNVVPGYIRDHKEYSLKKQQNRIKYLCRGTSQRDLEVDQPQKWKVQEPKQNQWRRNTVDQRTLYSLRDDELDTDSSKMRPLPKDDDMSDAALGHHQRMRERRYTQTVLDRSALEAIDKKRFSLHAMDTFHEPDIEEESQSYGNPNTAAHNVRKKTSTLADVITMVNSRKNRRTSSMKVQVKFPSSTKCREENHFCQVLGPGTCMRCIERTNRSAARRIQRKKFPDISCTAQSLVAPKLARVMEEGSKHVSVTAPTGEYLQTRPPVSRPSRTERLWEERARTFIKENLSGGQQPAVNRPQNTLTLYNKSEKHKRINDLYDKARRGVLH